MASNFYLTVDSNDANNLTFYPDNKAWKFKVHLDVPLNLSGSWKVALTDIFVRDNNKITYVNNLYIHCDLAGESIMNGERRQSLLRMVHYVKKGNWTHQYTLPYYVDVNKSLIFDIEFYIKDRKSEYASFLKQPVTLTLHFRHFPFLL